MTDKPFTPPKIAQIELHCASIEEARRFYCETLGFAVVGEFGDSLFVKCGGVNLVIQQTALPRRGSVIYFSADGCVNEATSALKAQGVTFKPEPTCIARGHEGHDIWLGFFDDPFGNPLALLGNMPVS